MQILICHHILFQVTTYHIISTGRYASNHGGLVIYLNDIWTYDIITCDTDSHIWERQIIEITNPSNIAGKKITIGNIYRPRYNLQDNIDTFMAEFNTTLLQHHGNSNSTYFCGDYNIDLFKITRVQMYEDYFDNILSAGYIPTMTLPTRLSNNSTLIDNIFTNNVGNKLTANILNVHISDHQPIVLFSNDELPTVKSKYITITNNSDEAKAAFLSSFENKHVLEQLVETNRDPNYNYEILEKALTDSYTECFPKRVVKFNKKKHKKNAWISVGIIRSINHRNRLYKHLKQMKTDSFDYVIKKANFNRFRNVLKKTITHAKRLHYKRLFDQFKYDMKKTWKIISDSLNRTSHSSIPDTMVINGLECTDKKEIADSFNSFFVSIGEQNNVNVERHKESHFRDYLTDKVDAQFAFRSIRNSDTVRMIKNIKLSNTKGHDGISSDLLKLIGNAISKSITLIINQSLTTGIFPDRLKIAKVIPIFKKDSKKLIKNYRPISVLPVISKIFEMAIHEQLCDYFTVNGLFSTQQYGFMKNASTELAALELIDRLLNQLNARKIPINLYLDLAKAFDCISHDILLEKLRYYGVNDISIQLLKSYLSNRKQYVQIGDVLSSMQYIKTGIPQGSIVGPLFFSIYINDIVKCTEKFNCILYADDTTLNSTIDSFGKEIHIIERNISAELQKISKWLELNRLQLNTEKSKFMLFHMPQKSIPNLQLTISGSIIEHVTQFKFLGLNIDSNLNWKAHLSAVSTKVSRVIGLLHKLKYMFPSYILRMIYNSLILPHFNYSLLAWGCKCQNIETLQKKAIRIVHSKSPIAHTEPILKTMNQLKLSDMYTCHLLKLYYKLYRNRLPTYFENFIPEYAESSHNLRNRHIHLPDVRCEFGKLNAKYQMHLRLRELAIPPNPPIYPLIDINDDILSKSLSYFSGHIKSMFTSSYIFECNIYNCYVCENSN